MKKSKNPQVYLNFDVNIPIKTNGTNDSSNCDNICNYFHFIKKIRTKKNKHRAKILIMNIEPT